LLLLLLLLEIDIFGQFDREVKSPLAFSTGFPDLVADELRTVANALVAAGGLEEFVQWDADAADLFLAEGRVGIDFDLEKQATLLQGGLVEGKIHNLVPGGIGAVLFVLGRPLPVFEIVGDPCDCVGL
jgi:hypothetical protein